MKINIPKTLHIHHIHKFCRVWLCLLFLSACSKPEHQPHTLSKILFGVPLEIIYFAPHQAQLPWERWTQWEHAWHPWRNDSAWVPINQAIQQGHNIEITDPHLRQILQASAQAERDSQGWFNPAMGQWVATWGFQRESMRVRKPSAEMLKAWQKNPPSLARLRWQSHSLLPDQNQPYFQLDLGGALKGWMLDEIAQELKTQGIHSALINFGGNVKVLGRKHDRPWRVGIQDPRKPHVMAVVSLHDGEAIGTSGDYQRFDEADGLRYCHLIHPKTADALCIAQSATVIASSGWLSDVASKPLYFGDTATTEAMGIRAWLRIDAQGKLKASKAMHDRLEWRIHKDTEIVNKHE